MQRVVMSICTRRRVEEGITDRRALERKSEIVQCYRSGSVCCYLRQQGTSQRKR